MKKIFAVVTAIVLTSANLNAQEHLQTLSEETSQQNMKLSDGSVFGTLPYILLWAVNPIVVYEDKEVNIGLTKEVSVFVFPYLRFAGEYSRIFRTENKNQIRLSMNTEIPLTVTDFAAVSWSVGGGYFSDLKYSGYFPQISLSILFAPADNVGTNIYMKSRYTFVTQKEKSNIFDFSIGAGLMFWF